MGIRNPCNTNVLGLLVATHYRKKIFSSHTKTSTIKSNPAIMKRSKTSCTASISAFKCYDIHLKIEHRDIPSSSRRKEYSFSHANASWEQPVSTGKFSGNFSSPKRTRNMFLHNDREINSLLTLLRTNNFSGQFDPTYHSAYLKEPRTPTPSNRRPRRLGEKKASI